MLWRDGQRLRAALAGMRGIAQGDLRKNLAQNEVAKRHGVLCHFSRALKILGQPAFGGELLGRIGGQPVPLHVAHAALVGQGGDGCADLGHFGVAEVDFRQIGVGKVAVIGAVFLAAHGGGLAGLLVVAAGFLHHGLPRFQRLHLPPVLGFDGALHALEGVEVLHFGAHAEGLSGPVYAQVHVAAHAALVHAAVAHARVGEDGTELSQIRHGLLRGADVRLGNDLDQRHAASVHVQRRAGFLIVQELARVLLDVDAGDAHALFPRAGLDDERSPLAQGAVELADLIGFGQVGIKVILAVEAAAVVHMAAQRHAGHGRIAQHLGVEHRQRPRQSHAHGTHMRVGLRAEGVFAGAEHLAFCAQLHMRFQADDHFICPVHARASSSTAS